MELGIRKCGLQLAQQFCEKDAVAVPADHEDGDGADRLIFMIVEPV